MSWDKYSYVRLTIRLDGKNDVKTYRFNNKEDVELLAADMTVLIAGMRMALDELNEPQILIKPH